MKNLVNLKYFTYMAGTLLLLILSCNKKFDEPPLNADPEIPVTMTIQELKARYQGTGIFETIHDEQVISGVVVADDRSGNFFKQIVIQDETGGLPIQIDMNSIYSSYPIGRRIFVKLKGLMMGDYGGTIQLGLDSVRSSDGRFLNLGRIPQTLLPNYITGGSYGNVVTPKIIKPSQFSGNINDALLSTLVQINNVEFRDADLIKTYANAESPTQESARNFTIKPCDDTKSIVLRNSSYATFAGLPVPQGNGQMAGILSVFNNTLQIAIRDTFDIQFKGERCSGQTPVNTTKTIAEILAYATGDSTIPAGTWIEGVIVSDTKNEAARNYRLQDATAGLQLRFTTNGNPSAALGDKYAVYVGGLKLSLFNGSLQIDGVETANKTGTGTITPKTTTIADIIAAGRSWESQVVTIKNVTISGSGSNYTIKDATGELVTFIRTSSGITMPTAATGITGYVSIYQSANATNPIVQLVLRTQDDIAGGTNNPPDNPPATGAIDLGITSPLLLNFDNVGSGLPAGVKIYTGAKADAIGTEATFTTNATLWNQVSGAFKNFASATGLSATSDAAAQNGSTNRALGLRQTGSFGDGSAAFVFIISNTQGKSNLKIDFLLQQLDASGTGRTASWTVDYATGDNPANFTTIATTPSSLSTTLGTFASTPVSVTLPAALNNLDSKVWIRIANLSATTGGGSRPSTAIDDFKISW